jgi:hypothetical protein
MITTPDLPRRLALSYSALARGLLVASENFYPYKPFYAAFDPDQELTPDTFRAALKLARFFDIYPNSGDAWFEEMIAVCRDPDQASDIPGYRREDAIVYEHLQWAMQATLDGPLENWYITAWDKPFSWFYYTRRYIFGRVENGGLAGLLALIVKT